MTMVEPDNLDQMNTEWEAWRTVCVLLKSAGVDVNDARHQVLVYRIRIWGEERAKLRATHPADTSFGTSRNCFTSAGGGKGGGMSFPLENAADLGELLDALMSITPLQLAAVGPFEYHGIRYEFVRKEYRDDPSRHYWSLNTDPEGECSLLFTEVGLRQRGVGPVLQAIIKRARREDV